MLTRLVLSSSVVSCPSRVHALAIRLISASPEGRPDRWCAAPSPKQASTHHLSDVRRASPLALALTGRAKIVAVACKLHDSRLNSHDRFHADRHHCHDDSRPVLGPLFIAAQRPLPSPRHYLSAARCARLLPPPLPSTLYPPAGTLDSS